MTLLTKGWIDCLAHVSFLLRFLSQLPLGFGQGYRRGTEATWGTHGLWVAPSSSLASQHFDHFGKSGNNYNSLHVDPWDWEFLPLSPESFIRPRCWDQAVWFCFFLSPGQPERIAPKRKGFLPLAEWKWGSVIAVLPAALRTRWELWPQVPYLSLHCPAMYPKLFSSILIPPVGH